MSRYWHILKDETVVRTFEVYKRGGVHPGVIRRLARSLPPPPFTLEREGPNDPLDPDVVFTVTLTRAHQGDNPAAYKAEMVSAHRESVPASLCMAIWGYHRHAFYRILREFA